MKCSQTIETRKIEKFEIPVTELNISYIANDLKARNKTLYFVRSKLVTLGNLTNLEINHQQ